MTSITQNKKPITPNKIICVGRNYVEHIQELNNEMPEEPVLFIKPNSAISTELYTDDEASIHYESEICFVIEQGRLAAVGIGLDLTKRDLQSKLKAKGLPWERAKAFVASAVFSEFVSFSGDCSQLRLEMRINDQLVQLATYDLMIHKPEALLAEIAGVFSWQDGDLLMTGTPKGVGAVKPGDKFTATLFEAETILVTAEWIAKCRS
jgi:2-keto-4-pentenoate hydratase/2-oxohepta-3-ene-1,7-dioic acid hydratase in catechol pathway